MTTTDAPAAEKEPSALVTVADARKAAESAPAVVAGDGPVPVPESEDSAAAPESAPVPAPEYRKVGGARLRAACGGRTATLELLTGPRGRKVLHTITLEASDQHGFMHGSRSATRAADAWLSARGMVAGAWGGDSFKGLTVAVRRADVAEAAPVAAAPECTVENARRAAEEWPTAMECRSVGQRYEGEFRASALLSELAVCGERFPLRWEAQPKGAGGYVVTLPTGRVGGTWGDVTRAAIGHVIQHRPGSVVAAAAERERAHAIKSEFAADAAERDTAALVRMSLVWELGHAVGKHARLLMGTHDLSEEQEDALLALEAHVRRAVKDALGAQESRRYGWWDDVRSAAVTVMGAAARLGVEVPSAAEVTVNTVEREGRWPSPERSVPSEFLLSITRPGPGDGGAAPVPDTGGGAGGAAGDVQALDAAPEDAAAAALAAFNEAAADAPRNLSALGRKALAHGWEVGPWSDGSRWHLVVKGLFLAADSRGTSGMVETVAEAIWSQCSWESGRVSFTGRDISKGAGSRVHEYGYRELGTFVAADWLTPVDRDGERERRTAEGRSAQYWLERAGEASGRAAEQCARAVVAMDAVTARRGEAAWVAVAELEGGSHYRAAERIASRCRAMVERLAFEVSDADARGAVADARRAFEVAGRVAALVKVVGRQAQRLEHTVLKPEAAAVFEPLLARTQAEQDARDVERLAGAPGMDLETFLQRVRGIRLEKVREVSGWHEFEGTPREQWGKVLDAGCVARLYASTAEGDVSEDNERPLFLAVFALAAAAGHEEVAAAGRALYEPNGRRAFGAASGAAGRAWQALTGNKNGRLSMLSPWEDVVTLDAMVRGGRAPAGAQAAALRERLLVEVGYRDRFEARSAARDVQEKWQTGLHDVGGAVNVPARLAALDAGCGPSETYRRELLAGWARRHWYKAAHPCPVVRVEGYRTIAEPGPVDVGAARLLAQWAAQVWAEAGSAPAGEQVPGGLWRGNRWHSSPPKELTRGMERRAQLSETERAALVEDAAERAARDAAGWLASVMPSATLGPSGGEGAAEIEPAVCERQPSSSEGRVTRDGVSVIVPARSAAGVVEAPEVPEEDDAPASARTRHAVPIQAFAGAPTDELIALGAVVTGAHEGGRCDICHGTFRLLIEGEQDGTPFQADRWCLGRYTDAGAQAAQMGAQDHEDLAVAFSGREWGEIVKSSRKRAAAQQEWEDLERVAYASWWVRAIPAGAMDTPAVGCGEEMIRTNHLDGDGPVVTTAYGHKYRVETNHQLKKPFVVKRERGGKVGASADRGATWAMIRQDSERRMLEAADDHIQRAQVGAPQGEPDEAWEITHGGWKSYGMERFGERFVVWEGPGHGRNPKTRRLVGIVDSRAAADQLVRDAYDVTRARLVELAERDRQAREAAERKAQEAAEREAAELAATAEKDARAGEVGAGGGAPFPGDDAAGGAGRRSVRVVDGDAGSAGAAVGEDGGMSDHEDQDDAEFAAYMAQIVPADPSISAPEQTRAERSQWEVDRVEARFDVPRLGWSEKIAKAAAWACQDLLTVSTAGVFMAGGVRVAAGRVRLLEAAGFVTVPAPKQRGPVRATADGRRASRMATVYPEGLHETDKDAKAARFKAAYIGQVSKQQARKESERLPFLPGGDAERAHHARWIREAEEWAEQAPARQAELDAIRAEGDRRDAERAAERERRLAECEAERQARAEQAAQRRAARWAHAEHSNDKSDGENMSGMRRVTVMRIMSEMWHATTQGEVFYVAKEDAGWVVVAPDDTRIGSPVIGEDREPNAESIRDLVRAHLDGEPVTEPPEAERADAAPAQTEPEDDRGDAENGYTWADVRRRPAAGLAVGDVFVVPAMGVAYEELSEGAVRGAGVGLGMALEGVAWTVTERRGALCTAESERGERRTEHATEGVFVLRVESADVVSSAPESLRNVADSASGDPGAFFAAGPGAVAGGVGSGGGVHSGPVDGSVDVRAEGDVTGGVGRYAPVVDGGWELTPEGNYRCRPASRATAVDLNETSWAVECDRHGPMTVLVNIYGEPTQDTRQAGRYECREDAEFAAELHLDEHQRRDAGVMTPEEIEEAQALALSKGQDQLLDWAAERKVVEHVDGFWGADVSYTRDDVWKKAYRPRVLTFWAAGYLRAECVEPGARDLVLTDKGRRARRMWNRALKLGLVEYASKENRFGVSAADLRRYPLLSEDRGFEGEELGPNAAERQAAKEAEEAETARIAAERETLPAAAVELAAAAEAAGWRVHTKIERENRYSGVQGLRDGDGGAFKAVWQHKDASGWVFYIGAAASDFVTINNIPDLEQVRRCVFDAEALGAVKVPDVISASGVEVWGDEGGYCPGVQAPRPVEVPRVEEGEPEKSEQPQEPEADIEITHTPAEGTQVHDTSQGDAASEILKRKEYGRRGGMAFKSTPLHYAVDG
ncbi:hypothetical protein AOB60_00240 [Streptomyces noursei]|uniref:Uncharacterized protein n=1 Tax=Streptomyces noursei TaxID=1971 RepID=A0A2N8PQW1_STRNR|nr:hypothetical protein AOB60_00240 [Streptomyces noursei]